MPFERPPVSRQAAQSDQAQRQCSPFPYYLGFIAFKYAASSVLLSSIPCDFMQLLNPKSQCQPVRLDFVHEDRQLPSIPNIRQ